MKVLEIWKSISLASIPCPTLAAPELLSASTSLGLEFLIYWFITVTA